MVFMTYDPPTLIACLGLARAEHRDHPCRPGWCELA
jgi:hypothetical protein